MGTFGKAAISCGKIFVLPKRVIRTISTVGCLSANAWGNKPATNPTMSRTARVLSTFFLPGFGYLLAYIRTNGKEKRGRLREDIEVGGFLPTSAVGKYKSQSNGLNPPSTSWFLLSGTRNVLRVGLWMSYRLAEFRLFVASSISWLLGMFSYG